MRSPDILLQWMVVPPSRRVYYIPELFSTIVSFLRRPPEQSTNSDLCRLALSTKYGSEFALDALWAELRALYPLTYPFPSAIHLPASVDWLPLDGCCFNHIGHCAEECPERGIGWPSSHVSISTLPVLSLLSHQLQTHTLPMPFNQNDWYRFQLYAKRIRSVVVLSPEMTPYLSVLLHYAQNLGITNVFPNLRHLAFSTNAMYGRQMLSMFISPTLVSLCLHVFCWPDIQHELRALMQVRQLSLQTLEICSCRGTKDPNIHDTIVHVIKHSPSLTSLAYNVRSAVTLQFLHLMPTLTRVHTLTLDISSSILPLVDLHQFSISLPSLSNLTLIWTQEYDTSIACTLLTVIAAKSTIRHCCLCPNFDISAEDMQSLCSIVASLPSLCTLTLQNFYGDVTEFDPDDPSMAELASPLFALNRLTHFRWQGIPFPLSADFYNRVPSAWPQLRFLTLDHIYSGRNAEYLDVVHLRTLLVNMHHLEYLAAPIRSTWLHLAQVLPLLVPVTDRVHRTITLRESEVNILPRPILVVSYLYMALPSITFTPTSSNLSEALAVSKTVISPSGVIDPFRAYLLDDDDLVDNPFALNNITTTL